MATVLKIETLVPLLLLASCILGQELSNLKCEEYAEAVYQKPAIEMAFRTLEAFVPTSTCSIYENPLIIGGTQARSREFPHMAVIGFGPSPDSNLDWFCGGSLISDKHVLTAAHCTISQSGPPQKVRLGSINLEEEDDYVQEILIDKALNHPKYNKPIKYHDIALLFLKNPVVFSEFVRPACLNSIKEFEYSEVLATGFGKMSFEKEETSKSLLKVKLDIIPKKKCLEIFQFSQQEMPQGFIESMMCAGAIEGGRDTCQGDSGGPLQVTLEKPYCMYSIIGITSFGRFCGMAYSPGIYTKVDEYIPWIESTIWTLEYFTPI